MLGLGNAELVQQTLDRLRAGMKMDMSRSELEFYTLLFDEARDKLGPNRDAVLLLLHTFDAAEKPNALDAQFHIGLCVVSKILGYNCDKFDRKYEL